MYNLGIKGAQFVIALRISKLCKPRYQIHSCSCLHLCPCLSSCLCQTISAFSTYPSMCYYHYPNIIHRRVSVSNWTLLLGLGIFSGTLIFLYCFREWISRGCVRQWLILNPLTGWIVNCDELHVISWWCALSRVLYYERVTGWQQAVVKGVGGTDRGNQHWGGSTC